jgi:hypothetical protein
VRALLEQSFVATPPGCGEDVRYRVRYRIDKGRILDFVVQLEYQEEKWRPVIRFDTAHGFAHHDDYRPNGSVTQHIPMICVDYNDAMTQAISIVQTRALELIKPFQEKHS